MPIWTPPMTLVEPFVGALQEADQPFVLSQVYSAGCIGAAGHMGMLAFSLLWGAKPLGCMGFLPLQNSGPLGISAPAWEIARILI